MLTTNSTEINYCTASFWVPAYVECFKSDTNEFPFPYRCLCSNNKAVHCFGTELLGGCSCCRDNGNTQRGCWNLLWTGLWGVCVSHTVNSERGSGSQRTSVTKSKRCWFVEFKGGDKYNSSALLGSCLPLWLMLVTTKHTHTHTLQAENKHLLYSHTERYKLTRTLAIVRGALEL